VTSPCCLCHAIDRRQISKGVPVSVKSYAPLPARASCIFCKFSPGRPRSIPAAEVPRSDARVYRANHRIDAEYDGHEECSASTFGELADGRYRREAACAPAIAKRQVLPQRRPSVGARHSSEAAIRGSAGVSQSATSDRSRSWVFRKAKSTGLVMNSAAPYSPARRRRSSSP